MKIIKLFREKKPVISCEIFPPKSTLPIETIFSTLDQLKKIGFDFISVTYGAGGSAQQRTKEIAVNIKKNYHTEVLEHLTCIEHSEEEIKQVLTEMKKENIKNVLALRGDIPKNGGRYLSRRDFKHAVDLIKYIKSHGDLCIAAAAYPEGHFQCTRISEDMFYLKEKVDCGVDFLITQLFFDNRVFYNFIENVQRLGINCPITVGVLPVLNANQIKRIISLCEASLPAKLLMLVDKYGDKNDEMEKAGIEYATKQIRDLIDNGVDGIHLYTMNKAQQIKEILMNSGLR